MDNYKKNVIELLDKYVDDEMALIFEYSGDFTKSLIKLEQKTLEYIKKLEISYDDSLPILLKIRKDIRTCNGN